MTMSDHIWHNTAQHSTGALAARTSCRLTLHLGRMSRHSQESHEATDHGLDNWAKTTPYGQWNSNLVPWLKNLYALELVEHTLNPVSGVTLKAL